MQYLSPSTYLCLNLECFRSNQEQLRKRQLYAFWQESNLRPGSNQLSYAVHMSRFNHKFMSIYYDEAKMVRAQEVDSVAQLVRALNRYRRAVGSIPAQGLIVAFFTAVPG